MSKPKGHINRATGRNKRDKSPVRDDKPASPERWDGKIVDRAASARKMGVERALRRRGRHGR
jgi:hypothetical protein